MKNPLLYSALILIALYFASCDFVMAPKNETTPVIPPTDSIVTFIEPDNNVSYPEGTNFTITWYQCNNAFKYELQFSDDSLFTSPITNWIMSPHSYFNTNSGTCSSSCNHFYRIRAYFPPNNTSERYWSVIKKYNTSQ